MKNYAFKAEVWLYPGESASWHFATVPQDLSEKFKKNHATAKRGFGSIRVTAKIGKTEWKTSLFPDKRASAYILPIKADVRRKEGIMEGDSVALSITIGEERV